MPYNDASAPQRQIVVENVLRMHPSVREVAVVWIRRRVAGRLSYRMMHTWTMFWARGVPRQRSSVNGEKPTT